MNFVVLSSSRGTTFQAVLDAIATGDLEARCIGLITDRADRQCIEKATAAELPWRVVERDKAEERSVFDASLNNTILELTATEATDPADLVIAEMGWMWIHTSTFIQAWPGRILNVHPSLLPKYGGKGMYGDHVHQAVLDAGDAASGVTVHVMDEGIDTGKILEQKSCSIEPNETVASLRAKVQQLEREVYPAVLQKIEEGGILLD